MGDDHVLARYAQNAFPGAHADFTGVLAVKPPVLLNEGFFPTEQGQPEGPLRHLRGKKREGFHAVTSLYVYAARDEITLLLRNYSAMRSNSVSLPSMTT